MYILKCVSNMTLHWRVGIYIFICTWCKIWSMKLKMGRKNIYLLSSQKSNIQITWADLHSSEFGIVSFSLRLTSKTRQEKNDRTGQSIFPNVRFLQHLFVVGNKIGGFLHYFLNSLEIKIKNKWLLITFLQIY